MGIFDIYISHSNILREEAALPTPSPSSPLTMAQVGDVATVEAAVNVEEKKDEEFRRYSAAYGFETEVVPKRMVLATDATDAYMKCRVLDYI